MRKALDEVRTFMKLGGQPTPEHPTWTGYGESTLNGEERLRELGKQLQHEGSHLRANGGIGSAVDSLRIGIILEEVGELAVALGNRSFVEVADAIADLLYVTLGAAVTYGIDIGPVWDEVHRSKLDETPPDLGSIMVQQLRESFVTVFSHPELEPESLLACRRCGGVFPVDPCGEENLISVGGVLVPKCLWCGNTGLAESKVTLSMHGERKEGEEFGELVTTWTATAFFEDPPGATETFEDSTPYGAYRMAVLALGVEWPGATS